MAEELQLNIKVGGADSLASLKKEFKDLQSELEKTEAGTKEYYQTLSKLGKVKDDIGDLRDTIGALNPEGEIAAFQNVAGKLAGGFQAATGAAALLGIQSEDLQQQLLKVQAATAFAEGIRSISGLGDAFRVLGAVLKSNPIFIIAGVITGIVAAVKLYNDAFGEMAVATKRVTEENKALAASYDEVAAKIDRNIKLASAAGQDQIKILELQVQKYDELNKSLSKQADNYATLYEKSGFKTQEFYDKAIDLEQKAVAAAYDGAAVLLQIDKVKADRRKKELEDEEKDKAARILNFQKMIDEMRISQEQYDEFIRKEHEDQQAQEIKDAQDIIAAKKAEDAALEAYLTSAYEKEDQMAEQNKAKRKADIEEINTARLQAEMNTFSSFQQLSAAYFQGQLASAQGNAAETDKIRKKQFETEKAFSIARAIIDGVRAVQGALAQAAVLGPFAGVLAASYGFLAAANVAKIASTQYTSTSTAGSSGPALGSIQAPIPTNPVPTIATRQNNTNLNENGYVLAPMEAYVVESKITSTQSRVNTLKRRATFG